MSFIENWLTIQLGTNSKGNQHGLNDGGDSGKWSLWCHFEVKELKIKDVVESTFIR